MFFSFCIKLLFSEKHIEDGMASSILPLTTIGVILVFSIVLSIFFKRIGQNPVLGFILSGFLLGPFVFGFLSPQDELVKAFAELGLFVLLFYLGIELSFKDFMKAGVPTVILAVMDMVALAAIGFISATLLGFSFLFSAGVGLMLLSTSSAIVGKFILDRELSKQKSAQLALAILILQDFLGIMLLVFISSLSGSNSALSLSLTAGVFAMVAFYAVHRVSGFVERFFEKHKLSEAELSIYGLGIGLVVATLGSFLGLAPALGTYFAGFALSELKAGEKVKMQIGFLRDFFLLFFFVSFGTSLFFDTALNQAIIPPLGQLVFLIALSLFLSIASIIAHAAVFTFFGPVFGITNRESSEVAIFLTPLGEFVIIIALSILPLLSSAEALMLAPIAFLVIVFTLLLFQPIYNLLDLHDKLTARLPAFTQRPQIQSPLKEYSPLAREALHDLGVNLILCVCLVWITILLYEHIPTIGIPVPFGRAINATILLAFFSIPPLVKVFRSAAKLWEYAKETRFAHVQKFASKNQGV